MVKVTTTIQPGQPLDVSESEAKDLERMGLLEQDQPQQGEPVTEQRDAAPTPKPNK